VEHLAKKLRQFGDNAAIRRARGTEIPQPFVGPLASPTIAVRPDERPSAAVVSVNLMGARTGRSLGEQGHAWKTTSRDVVSIFLADDRRTAPCAGTGRKAGPTPAHRR
jgi:hypothetical protein